MFDQQGTPIGVFDQPHYYRNQVDVAIADVKRDHAPRLRVLAVHFERLRRDQVSGNRITTECIQCDNVITLLRPEFLIR